MKTPPKNRKTVASIALLLNDEQAMIGMLNQYVTSQLELASLTAAHEEEVARLNAAFEENKRVEELRGELAALGASIQLFCEERRAELFTEKKSRDYTNATIGFREGPPAFAKKVKNDSEEAIGERMGAIEALQAYVDWVPKIDKKALIKHRADLAAADLAKAGITFTQTEAFYIDPKAASAERSAAPVGAVAA